MVAEMEWQAEALSLKEQGLSSAEIADAVGKHPATVRKVLARASVEPSSNGNGHGPIDAETAARLRDAATGDGDPPAGPIPGQIDIDGGETGGDIFPDGRSSGPEEERDPTPRYDKDAFEAEAGEAVGPMPPRAPEGEITYVEKPRIDGTQQVAFDFGGELAEEGTLTFTGTFPSGFFEKGDVITGSFKARVVGVAGKDKLDKKSGTFSAAPQAHVALITVLEVY
jgi:hypothetical protein